MADLPWRQGKRVPEHIYDAQGRPLVTMPSAELAAFVVACVNGQGGAARIAELEKLLREAARHMKNHGVDLEWVASRVV